ncbi:MAG: PKD domain-containing protein [Bacteroidota bacterium]
MAALIDIDVSASDWDYNDYYSAGDEFGSYLGTLYSDLASWGLAINADANSSLLNPFYLDEEELRPTQRAINGAGIAASGVLLDIDGELRNQSAPDVGADEYLVDFGITRLLSPTLSCGLTSNDSVTIVINQYGDVPFMNLKVAYQVNGGAIDIDTVPGALTNDIIYTFNSTQDLAGYGTYQFKIWLIGSNDDNINNDTLIVNRYSSKVPHVDFTYSVDCAGQEIPLAGFASVETGSIASYEWIFDNRDTTKAQNTSHVFETSDPHSVTLRAYTVLGCYGDTTKEVEISVTPQAGFTKNDVCYAEEVQFINTSNVSSGEMTFAWDFGDGTTSGEASPSHTYAESGAYEVILTSTIPLGCSNETSDTLVVNQEMNAQVEMMNDTARVVVQGGTPFIDGEPYIYLWSNGMKTGEVSGLEDGKYSVTVTDATGCTVVDSIESIFPELRFSMDSTLASCMWRNTRI